MFGRNNLVKELVNVFNLNSYYSDAVSAGFTLENGKIVGLFDRNVDIEKYFAAMQKDIVARYCDNENKASEILDFKSFPFNIDESKCKYNKGEKVKKLVIDVTPGVMYNLKVHSALAFQKAVEWRVAATLEDPGQITREEAYGFVKECIKLRKANHSDLYSISFDDDEVQDTYIDIFKLRLEVCGIKSSVFYTGEGNKLYIKDINNVNVIKSIGEYVAERIALDLKISGKEEPKVENLKDNLTDLILELTGQSIEGYDYDTFIDRNKESNFAFIPLVERNGLSDTLNTKEANKINKAFKEKGWCKEDLLINIKGQSGRQLGLGEPVYAITCKQFALLMPKLMKSPVEYNEREQLFEYIVPLDKNQVEEALNSNANTPPTERRFLDVPAESGYSSAASSFNEGGILPRNASAQSFITLKQLAQNEQVLENANMSGSLYSTRSSGYGSTASVSQPDNPQQSTTDVKPDQALPPVAEAQIEKSISSTSSSGKSTPSQEHHGSRTMLHIKYALKQWHELSGGHASEGALTKVGNTTSQTANKTSQEKPKDLSSSTSIRSSFKNLNVFKHTRGVNTYKSDQREKSSCSIL